MFSTRPSPCQCSINIDLNVDRKKRKRVKKKVEEKEERRMRGRGKMKRKDGPQFYLVLKTSPLGTSLIGIAGFVSQGGGVAQAGVSDSLISWYAI